MTKLEVLRRKIVCIKRKSAINCTNCTQCDSYVEDAETLDAFQEIWAALVEKNPCNYCMHNPPSSFGGKPCSYCPAQKNISSDSLSTIE